MGAALNDSINTAKGLGCTCCGEVDQDEIYVDALSIDG